MRSSLARISAMISPVAFRGLVSFMFVVLVLVAVVPASQGYAPPTAEEMYIAVLAREEAVRLELGGDDSGAVASAVRAVVAEYREIVRVHPTSGYSDNALWQAALLSTDLFVRFGDLRDRTTADRLLRLLATEYPTSSKVREVPAQLARLGGSGRPTARVQAPTIATIKAIRREVLSDAVRVTIELDREVSFHDERIPNPVRVFVDLPATRPSAALLDKTLRFDGDTDIVHQIRIGRHPNNVTRVVLDGSGLSEYSIYALYAPFRLVIDCVRTPPALLVVRRPVGAPAAMVTLPAAPPVAPIEARAPVAAVPAPAAVVQSPVAPRRPDDQQTPLPTRSIPAVAATAPPRNLAGGYSLARQLGLSVSRIVIDPGHGGHDPGAKGKSVNEAELVLDIALRVEALLQMTPGVEVILTRRSDEYVELEERTAIANRESADLFLSIHANASGNAAARGVETYFLNFASNMSAASVAARENAASGHAMGMLPDYLKAIALDNKLDESREFATDVQQALVARLRKSNRALKDLGVKQAPFVVLIGAAMPSVLTEISFVTNTQEAKLLRSDAYRQRIAEALVNAIRKYQMSLKSVPKVAQQR